jgi:hypothetical protein
MAAARSEPEAFVNIPDVRPEEFQKATEHLYHSKYLASGLLFLQTLERVAAVK